MTSGRRHAFMAGSGIFVGLLVSLVAVADGCLLRGAQAGWAVGLLAVSGCVVWVPQLVRLRRLAIRFMFRSPAWLFRMVLFIVGFTSAVVVSRTVFGGLPRLDDSVSAVFQARIFASGHLTLSPPEHAEFFHLFAVLGKGMGIERWCTMYAPGWPLLLVPGVLLGATWLVNPLLLGCLVVAISTLGEEMMGRRSGRLSGLLAVCSPYLVVQGGMQLSHVATALMLTLCMLSVVRLLRAGRAIHGLAAGCSWGFALLCRPVTALVVGGALAVGMLVQWRKFLRGWRGVIAGALAAAVMGGCLAGWQKITTGNAGTPGHVLVMGDKAQLGFIRYSSRWEHTPSRAVSMSLRRIQEVDPRLLGWPVPGVLAVMLPFLLGRARGREWWLLLPWFGLLAVFALFWFWEVYYPARYTFAAMPFLLILAGRGVSLASARLRAVSRGGPRWVAMAVVWGCAFSALVAFPEHTGRFGPNHGDVEQTLHRCVEEAAISNAVVFIRAVEDAGMEGEPVNDFYATGFMMNDLELKNDVLFVRNLKWHNTVLMHAMPDRAHYLYTYNRRTGAAVIEEMREGTGDFVLRQVWSSEE